MCVGKGRNFQAFSSVVFVAFVVVVVVFDLFAKDVILFLELLSVFLCR